MWERFSPRIFKNRHFSYLVSCIVMQIVSHMLNWWKDIYKSVPTFSDKWWVTFILATRWICGSINAWLFWPVWCLDLLHLQVDFVIDERLRVKKNKHKVVLLVLFFFFLNFKTTFFNEVLLCFNCYIINFSCWEVLFCWQNHWSMLLIDMRGYTINL